MKKTICIIISALLLLCSLTACGNSQPDKETTGKKEDIFSEQNDEKALEDASSLSFYKEFLGGTGYKVDSLTDSHYEYDGGEMSIDYAVNNYAAGFECGLFVILNGVFQKFTFKDVEGEETDEAYMHITQIPEKERVTFTLTFKPNTGKKGDKLNLSVGTLTEPSYTSVYSGWPRYSKYGEHGYSGVSGMSVLMNCDSTGTVPSKKPEISKPEIIDEYFNYVTVNAETGKEREEWKNNYLFALYYDKYDFDRDLIAVPETDSVKLNLDIMGMAREYRVSLFINNEIVEFENGTTYFEVQNTADKVTHIEIPVDISEILVNSHIYAIIAEKDIDKSSMTYGTFVPHHKTRTCYFIKGEVPEGTNTTEADVTEETTSPSGTVNIAEGEIAAIHGMEVLYAASADSGTICFVLRDSNMNKKAVFLNKENNTVISETALSESAAYYCVSGEKLIVADSTKTKDGAYFAIDKNGNTTDKKPYVINSAAEKESSGALAMLSSNFKKVAIDESTGDMVYIAYDETYLISGSTGEKTKLNFLSNENVPTQIRSFSGGKILTLNTDDNGSTFTLHDTKGNKIGDYAFSESKDFSCVGSFTAVYTRKNLTGISSDNKVNLLNSLTGEMKELAVETNTENQWCTVSFDGKYILTLDNDFFFRLYDTESGKLIEKFNINGTEINLFEYQVFIDGDSKAIYIGVNESDEYGVYVKKF